MAQSSESWLLDVLVCPETKASLIRVADWLYSTDPQSRRRYAIKDGIPNMLIEESEVVSEEEFNRVVRQHDKKV